MSSNGRVKRWDRVAPRLGPWQRVALRVLLLLAAAPDGLPAERLAAGLGGKSRVVPLLRRLELMGLVEWKVVMISHLRFEWRWLLASDKALDIQSGWTKKITARAADNIIDLVEAAEASRG